MTAIPLTFKDYTVAAMVNGPVRAKANKPITRQFPFWTAAIPAAIALAGLTPLLKASVRLQPGKWMVLSQGATFATFAAGLGCLVLGSKLNDGRVKDGLRMGAEGLWLLGAGLGLSSIVYTARYIKMISTGKSWLITVRNSTLLLPLLTVRFGIFGLGVLENINLKENR